MTRTARRTLAALAAAGTLIAGTAVAAEPESGTVSFGSPRVEWTGAVTMSYFNRLPVLLTEDDSVPCGPEMCDAFGLEVADRSALTLAVNAPDTADGTPASVSMRITAPDGSVTLTTGEATPDRPHRFKIRNADTGGYTIEYFNNLVGGAAEYVGTAELAVPEPEEPPAAPVEPPPAEGFTVEVKAQKASARKLRRSRRLKARVTVSREVRSVAAVLKKGSRTVGRGRLGSFSGTRTLKLKLSRKVRAGRYRLAVEATDSAGTRVGRTVGVRVRR